MARLLKVSVVTIASDFDFSKMYFVYYKWFLFLQMHIEYKSNGVPL